MSLHLLRLKMIDLVRAGHVDRHEYELFSRLASASEPARLPPMEFVDTDATAPVFNFFEQQREIGVQSGIERI